MAVIERFLNVKLKPFYLLLLSLLFTGCSPQKSESPRYAELRIGDSDKLQVMIRSDYWTGLFGPEGYGGYRHNIYYWTTVDGTGPEYTNFVFHENGSEEMADILTDTPTNEVNTLRGYGGTIIVNRDDEKVTVSINRLLSSPGGQLKTEPSKANGTYDIKRVSKKPFYPDAN